MKCRQCKKNNAEKIVGYCLNCIEIADYMALLPGHRLFEVGSYAEWCDEQLKKYTPEQKADLERRAKKMKG